MNPTPVLIGFLAGAILGVLVTDLDRAQLGEQLKCAFHWRRLSQRRQTGRPEYGKLNFPAYWAWIVGRTLSHWIRVASHLLVVEWLLLLFVIWVLCVPVLWFIAANSHISWLDPDWFNNVFIGSLVGFAAAPWVWLHFSRDLIAGDGDSRPVAGTQAAPDSWRSSASLDVGESKAGAGDTDGLLKRYRFLTIALGILLLVAIFGPFLRDFLSRSNKVAAFGVSISLPERTSASQGGVFFPNPQVSVGNSASAKLTENTHWATLVGSPPIGRFASIGGDLVGFDFLSTVDRDNGYIAYFIHSADQEENPLSPRQYEDLQSYIAAADKIEKEKKLHVDPDKDIRFVQGTSEIFECLDHYANEVHDIHLYFLDTSDFLKSLAILLNQTFPSSKPAKDASPPALRQFQESVASIRNRIVTVLRGSGSEPAPCSTERDPSDPAYKSPPPVAPDGTTPYPAFLAFYSLAAVDSPEAGILYLSKWIAATEATDNRRVQERSGELGIVQATPLRIRWYLLHAKISLSQMAAKATKGLMEPERQVVYQRRMTDEFAELLGTRSTEAWRNFCDRLKPGDLHASIGRWLAFLYAEERNYLFELEEPALVQSWRQAGRSDLTGHLRDDLAEAIAYADTSECFGRHPNFRANRDSWLGQFNLNIAQLRIDLLPTLPASQIKVEVDEIGRLLDKANDQLGQTKPPDPVDSPINQLLSSAQFDDQRLRVQALRSVVANLSLPP